MTESAGAGGPLETPDASICDAGVHDYVTMIAAVGDNGVIGDGTSMPWHISEDLEYFKRTQRGHPW